MLKKEGRVISTRNFFKMFRKFGMTNCEQDTNFPEQHQRRLAEMDDKQKKNIEKDMRVCANKDCNTLLSVYNKSELCFVCQKKKIMAEFHLIKGRSEDA